MPLVQSTGVVSGVNVSSYNLTLNGVNSANTLILLCAGGASPFFTPTGFSVANQPGQFSGSGATVVSGIFYNTAPTSGTNVVTVAMTGSDYTNAVLLEWSGLAPSPLDLAPTGVNNSSASSTSGSNSVSSGVLSQASEVIFALLADTTEGSGTSNAGLTDPPSGFTSLGAYQDNSVNNIAEFCYLVVSATTSVTASWSWTDTTPWASQATMATFKLAASAVTPLLEPWQQRGGMGQIAVQ